MIRVPDGRAPKGVPDVGEFAVFDAVETNIGHPVRLLRRMRTVSAADRIRPNSIDYHSSVQLDAAKNRMTFEKLAVAVQPLSLARRLTHMQRRLGVDAFALVALIGISPAVAQDNAADTARLIDVLQVAPGQVLADIGAGPEALLSMPMGKAVGPQGKIYATEPR
jgi:hypothetical protein